MLLPLCASATSRRLPVLTIGILLVNVVVYWHQSHLRLWELLPFLSHYALVPSRLHAMSAPVAFSVLSSMFMHMDLPHLIGNMWFLWIFGGGVEDRLGRTRFLAFYFISGFVASALHVIANGASTKPVLGASGAIAGVLGAYMCMFPYSSVSAWLFIPFPKRIELPAAFFLGFWIVGELASAYIGQNSGVAFYAHIGGFAAGVVLALVIGPPRRRQP